MTHSISSKSYYSKLLLFGEHTILKGSQALAIPLPFFFGQWEFIQDMPAKELSSLQQNLPQFLNYLNDLKRKQILLPQLNLKQFEKDLNEGLFFKSNIPNGYGLGSSGALCAAIFDVYGTEKETDLTRLKLIFGQLESFFHGSSSGVDPLICFLNKPLFFASKEKAFVTRIPLENKTGNRAIFLLDTKISRKTGPLVQTFLTKCEGDDYNNMCKLKFVPEVNEAIENFLNSKWISLLESFHKIGCFQYEYFEEMIPDSYKEIWSIALKNDLYKLKLCGAGGGGFILGITENWKKTQESLSNYKLFPVFRF